MSRKHMGGGALLAPLPAALITVGSFEESNVLTVAWTGILATKPPRAYISIRPSRHSYGILKEGGEFVINLPRASMAREVDFAGIYTGKKVDKFKRCGFTRVRSERVAPPTIEQCPIALECRVAEILPMGTHDVFISDILSVSCDEAILDGEGKLRYELAELLAYAHGEYYGLGERVGRFGFSTDKDKTPMGKAVSNTTAEPSDSTKAKAKTKGAKNNPKMSADEVAVTSDGKTDSQDAGQASRPFYIGVVGGSKRGRTTKCDKGRPKGKRIKEKKE